jgi:general secretion pathway protein J
VIQYWQISRLSDNRGSTGYTQLGFTLIEVLIAMSLLSIMMLLLFSSMNTSVRNWDAGEQRISEVSKAAATYNFFRRHLTSIQPLIDDFSGDEEDAEFAFQGRPDAIRFVATLPASAGRMGLQSFYIALEQEQQKSGKIQVAIEPFFPVAEGRTWREDKVILIDQVASLTFSYFGLAEDEQEKDWHSEWLQRQNMPELIKIAITLDGGVIWPEIVVAPRILHKNNPIAAGSIDDIRSDDDLDEQVENDSDDPDL